MMMVCIGERCFRDEVIWLEVFRVRAFQAEGRAGVKGPRWEVKDHGEGGGPETWGRWAWSAGACARSSVALTLPPTCPAQTQPIPLSDQPSPPFAALPCSGPTLQAATPALGPICPAPQAAPQGS